MLQTIIAMFGFNMHSFWSYEIINSTLFIRFSGFVVLQFMVELYKRKTRIAKTRFLAAKTPNFKYGILLQIHSL